MYAALNVQVHLNSGDLSGLQVSDSAVQQRYRFKNLKAAMCHIPDSKEVGGPVSTKVRGGSMLARGGCMLTCCAVHAPPNKEVGGRCLQRDVAAACWQGVVVCLHAVLYVLHPTRRWAGRCLQRDVLLMRRM
jgi:hypothetical protein